MWQAAVGGVVLFLQMFIFVVFVGATVVFPATAVVVVPALATIFHPC